MASETKKKATTAGKKTEILYGDEFSPWIPRDMTTELWCDWEELTTSIEIIETEPDNSFGYFCLAVIFHRHKEYDLFKKAVLEVRRLQHIEMPHADYYLIAAMFFVECSSGVTGDVSFMEAERRSFLEAADKFFDQAREKMAQEPEVFSRSLSKLSHTDVYNNINIYGANAIESHIRILFELEYFEKIFSFYIDTVQDIIDSEPLMSDKLYLGMGREYMRSAFEAEDDEDKKRYYRGAMRYLQQVRDDESAQVQVMVMPVVAFCDTHPEFLKLDEKMREAKNLRVMDEAGGTIASLVSTTNTTSSTHPVGQVAQSLPVSPAKMAPHAALRLATSPASTTLPVDEHISPNPAKVTR